LFERIKAQPSALPKISQPQRAEIVSRLHSFGDLQMQRDSAVRAAGTLSRHSNSSRDNFPSASLRPQ
jgi:hypothetical protein